MPRKDGKLRLSTVINELEIAPTVDTEPKWISVEDRLPDMCGYKCLVCGVNMFSQIEVFTAFTGYMERGKLEFHSCETSFDISKWKITHWMPLPHPPEGEAVNEQ